tara:strand:+ start:297 stop:401 length:105 start_codon:yes stop_codon:yes gene_type:complete
MIEALQLIAIGGLSGLLLWQIITGLIHIIEELNK